MKSAVTICLLPEARQGPFVFHDGLAAACQVAAQLGYDAVEVLAASGQTFPVTELQRLLAAHGLQLAAVGTGAGWIKHKLHLCHQQASVRTEAADFITGIIDAAGACGAPAIIGSMQGCFAGAVSRDKALDLLADSLATLSDKASCHGQTLLYEPLNRYETNLFNRQADAADFLKQRSLHNVRLLCDLFHMNIEEADSAAAIRAVAPHIGHVHWADSNRQAMGLGHTDPRPVIACLREIGYHGYLSAEIFPLPTAASAAQTSIESLHKVITVVTAITAVTAITT